MPKAGLTAARVVLAGLAVADESGFDQVTVAAVAKRFGVAPASLYSHVGGTADLRARVATAALAEMADRAADAVAGRAGRDALVGLAGAYRDYAREFPGRYAAARHRGADVATGVRHSALARAVLRGYAVGGYPVGGHPVGEAEVVHAVRLIGSAVHGFVELEASGAFDHSEPPAAESWSRVLDVVHAGLSAWGSPG